jgi:hypothetical protein
MLTSALEAHRNGSWSGDNFTLGCRPYASPTPCVHSVNNPLCAFTNIDYLRFYYCHEDVDDFPPALKLPVLLLWCAVLFAAIAVVADNFFAPVGLVGDFLLLHNVMISVKTRSGHQLMTPPGSDAMQQPYAPAVERISERLKLPEDVAGATLLALGGAAPDIFTQAAALVEESTPDLRLALSESIGAGLFVATFGKALTIIVGLRHAGNKAAAAASGEGDGASAAGAAGTASTAPAAATAAAAAASTGISVEPFPYLRDVIAYLALICLGYVVTAVDTVSTPLAGSFMVIYALYVLTVVRGRQWMEPWLGGALGCLEAPPGPRVLGGGPKIKRGGGCTSS